MWIGDEEIEAGCIVWGAGVKASPAYKWLSMEAPRGGRIPVGADLQVSGIQDIYAIGDTALALGNDNAPLPALAQVAKQQGQYLGRMLRAPAGQKTHPFSFKNRGNTAVVGRHAAIFDFGRWTLRAGQRGSCGRWSMSISSSTSKSVCWSASSGSGGILPVSAAPG